MRHIFAELSEERFQANEILTTAAVLDALEGRPPHGPLGMAAEIDYRVRFFHWALEFPEVFARGGFDIILCNPPWERIKLQQEEFFSSRDLNISRAPNKAARERLIRELPNANLALWREYSMALHDADSLSRFLRASGLYPLTARGDINTYSVFAERFTAFIRADGRIGAVLPTGIATDDTNKQSFAHIATTGRLATLYDFENRERLFPAVDSRMKFSLTTIHGAAPATSQGAQFAFFLTRAEQLRDPQRIFPLTAHDFELLNPNTKTCPIFRTRDDAELTRKIYQRVPALVNESTGENHWGISFLRMFDMSNDSHLFRTRDWLEDRGFRLSGNRFVNSDELYLPLYEAKMIPQYDHRNGTFEGVTSRANVLIPTPTEAQHEDPRYMPLPWYWVNSAKVPPRSMSLGFRDLARSTDERTAIFTAVPLSAVGNKSHSYRPNGSGATERASSQMPIRSFSTTLPDKKLVASQ